MFTPVNRHILVRTTETATEDRNPLIVLPEDYAPQEERYGTVEAVAVASDVRFSVEGGTSLIVDKSMMEEISVGGTIYNVILDNYVVGIID